MIRAESLETVTHTHTHTHTHNVFYRIGGQSGERYTLHNSQITHK